MSLDISNGSTLPLTLTVNAQQIETIGAMGGDHIVSARLPALPWDARLLSPSGREILQLTVHEGDVHSDQRSESGVARRVDLSCGRIDMWSGPPLAGPMPGPGKPGDCVP